MPQTVEFEGLGLALDFPDAFTKDDINTWLSDNFDGNERDWKKQALRADLQSFNRDSRQYGQGYRWLNGIGSLASQYLQSFSAAGQTALRKGVEFNPITGMGPGGMANRWMIDKVLGFDPWNVLADKMHKMDKSIDEVTQVIPVDELGKKERFFTEDVAGGMGSGLAFIMGGWSMKGAMTGTQLAMYLGSMIGYSTGYNRSIDAGDSEEMANFIGLLNAGIGLSEALPVGKWIDRINGKMGWSLGSLLREAGEEAVQEFFQSGLEDLAASIGNEDWDTMQTLNDMLRSGLAGGISGFALAGGTAIGSRGENGESVRPHRMTEAETAQMEGRGRQLGYTPPFQRETRATGPSGNVISVDESGVATQRDSEKHEDFIEGGLEFRAQTVEDAARELGQDPKQARKDFLRAERQRQKTRQAQAAGVTKSADYGGRSGIVQHGMHNGLVKQNVQFDGNNAVNRRDLDRIARAYANSLAPQNDNERRALNEFLAKRRRQDQQDKQMAALDVGQFNQPSSNLENRLFGNHMLNNWLRAGMRYIQEAELAGDNAAAERLRGQLADQLGLNYDPNAETFPTVYSPRTVENLASDPLADSRERDSIEQAYPLGTVVTFGDQADPDTQTTGQVVGHKISRDGTLDLLVATPEGGKTRVPAHTAQVSDPTPFGTKDQFRRGAMPGESQAPQEQRKRTSLTSLSDERAPSEYDPFTQPMDQWLASNNPLAVTVDLTKTLAEQGLRETQFTMNDWDAILQSVGVGIATSRLEALQRSREVRKAAVLMEKSDSTIDKEVPSEQLDDWAELFRVDGWRRRAKKAKKIQKLRRHIRAAVNGRMQRAKVLSYYNAAVEAALAGRQLMPTIVDDIRAIDQRLGDALEAAVRQGEQVRGEQMYEPWILDRFEPEFRDGVFKELKSGDEIPVVFDGYAYGYSEAPSRGLNVAFTPIGNWKLPNGTNLKNLSSRFLSQAEQQMLEKNGIKLTVVQRAPQSIENATLERAQNDFREAHGTEPEMLTTLDPKQDIFAFDEDGIETYLDEGGKPTSKEGLNEYTKAANFRGPAPMWVKPVYDQAGRGEQRIGFAMVGYETRGTQPMEPDDIAKKHGGGVIRRVQEVTGRERREPGEMEVFKPSVFVVLWDEQLNQLGHIAFPSVQDAKNYLKERLHDDGVRRVRARRPTPWDQIPQPAPPAPPASMGMPTPQAQRGAVEAPFAVGTEGQIPMRQVVRLRQRPEAGFFEVVGPLDIYPGITRIRNTMTGLEVDVNETSLTKPVELTPRWLLDLQRSSGFAGFSRVTRNPLGLAPGNLEKFSRDQRAQMVAMQTPINIPVGEVFSLSDNEVQALADREAFGDVGVLALRIGRNLRSQSHLNFVRGIQAEEGTNRGTLKNGIIAAATGNAQAIAPQIASQFSVLQGDMTYVPPYQQQAPVGREGFTQAGLPARGEERAQEATVKAPLQVIGREGDRVTVRDTLSGEVREMDASEVGTQESPDVRADTGVMQFERDLREAGESVDEVQRRLQRAPRRARRIANSHVPLSVPAKSFSYYIAEDFIELANQEGQGDMKAVAYRVGRNMTSITELNRFLEMRRDLKAKAEESRVLWDEQMLTDTRRLNNVINQIGWENLSDGDRASLILAGFVDPAIEAATGLNPNMGFSKTVELWQDPTYAPPFQCASPCNLNQEPQDNDLRRPPKNTVTPDTLSDAEDEPEAARWKRQRRKRTKSIQYVLLQDEWVRKYPSAFKTLRNGTYTPRSFEELRQASSTVVDQWDDGIDGLRELAQVAISNHYADRWWNVSDDMKPAVLVEIVERLDRYAQNMKAGPALDVINGLEERIWHEVQTLGSISGQMLNTFRYLYASLNKEYFLDRVVKRMFKKAGIEDKFSEVRPELERLKDLMKKAPAGTPKLRILAQMGKVLSKQKGLYSRMDKFWALWYNNVLSSIRTQFDNASMALNVVMETALNMAVQPGSAHLAFKGLMTGFHYAGQRFGQILKGDYSGRLGDPYEMMDKFSKDISMEMLRPTAIDSLINSENKFERFLGKGTGWVTHLMSAMDNVVMQGGFDVRVQTRAWQKAKDVLEAKAEEMVKAGKPWVYTSADIEQVKNEILRTTPEDIERYKAKVDEEVRTGVTSANERNIRLKELINLGVPGDIMEDAKHYARFVTGTSEPVGLVGKIHRIIANLKSKPNIIGYGTKAVFPFTRWAAVWTNIITDYMPPISLYRMHVYSPNTTRFEKLAGKFISPKKVEQARDFLLAGDKKLSPHDYNLLRARALAGFAFFGSAYALFSKFDDDDEPFLQITGGLYNVAPQRRNQLREAGIHPWSVVINGRSYGYRNLPIAGALGVVGNVKDSDRYGGTNEDQWKLMNAVFRGALMVKDMSVLSGASEVFDLVTNNRFTAEYRIRAWSSWFGRFAQGVVPLGNLQRDVEAWYAEIWDRPIAYNPTTAWGMLFRDWPWVQRLSSDQPALNPLGEPVDISRAPWARQAYPRRNDPIWEAVAIKAQQGVFLPTITTASKTDPATGNKIKMTETEEYRYKAEVYKRMGDQMRWNYSWYRYATPEQAQLWLDRISRQVRASVRYELGLQ